MESLWTTRRFREDALVLALFATVVHLLYAKTVQAGFVTDFTGLLGRLDGAPFLDFLTCFGFPAMHQVTNFFLFIFVKYFGVHGLPWYLVHTSLHIANGFLGYCLIKKILSNGGMEQPTLPALAAALLFLLSPYQADAVVWKVCFNFLSCTLLMLGSLLFLVKYSEQGKQRHLLWSHGLFALSRFTFELALALPFLAFVIAVARPFGTPSTGRHDTQNGASTTGPHHLLSFLKKITLPHILLLGGYFLLNKIVLGGWVGHYGEDVHLRFELRSIASNLLKYFTKYLFFWREMPHGYRESLMAFFEKPSVAYIGLALGGLLLVAGIYFFKKMPPSLRVTGMGWLLFFLALLPVANLHVAWILQGENDRYGYLASLFFFTGLVGLLHLFHRYICYGVLSLWLLASAFYLNRTTVAWQAGASTVNALLDGFHWLDAPEVYVLAFPENYQGIPMFKDFSRQDLALKHTLQYVAGKETAGDFFQIAQFNMTGPADGVQVEVDSAGTFLVQFNQWGNWWWRNGIGTWDYEKERYTFNVDGNGSRIALKKQPAPGAVFIYSQGGNWRTAVWSNEGK